MLAPGVDGEEATLADTDVRDIAQRVVLPDTDTDIPDSLSDDTSTYTLALSELDLRSALSRVPPELWWIIWARLPLESIVSVTHVCQYWRIIAIGCPRLWCSLRFRTSVSAPGCPCDRYTGSSNLHLMTGVLSRSQSLSLKISIRVKTFYSDNSIIAKFAAALVDHTPRIVSISFSTKDVDAPLAFFLRFSSLPALDHLDVRCPEDLDDGGRPLTHGENAKLWLPALRNLELSGGIGSDPLDMTLLKRLAVSYISAQSVLPLSMASPNLKMLQLRLPDNHEHLDPFDDCTTLNEVCMRIARVAIFNITPGTSAYASRLCTFEHPDISLFHSPCTAEATMEFLNTIERPTWLSIRSHAADSEINADGALLTADDASRKRSLWVPRRLMTAAWSSYAPDHFPPLVAIHIDLLALVASNVAAAVVTLSIWIPSNARLPPSDIPPFPALKALELRHTGAPGPQTNGRMFPHLVSMLRRGTKRKLRVLTFKNFPEDLDPEAFSSFADSVRVKLEPRRHGA